MRVRGGWLVFVVVESRRQWRVEVGLDLAWR